MSVAPHYSVDNATPTLDFEAVSQQLNQKKKRTKMLENCDSSEEKKIICCVRERVRACPCHVISLIIKKKSLAHLLD